MHTKKRVVYPVVYFPTLTPLFKRGRVVRRRVRTRDLSTTPRTNLVPFLVRLTVPPTIETDVRRRIRFRDKITDTNGTLKGIFFGHPSSTSPRTAHTDPTFVEHPHVIS